MNFLFIGDIVGRGGRQAVKELVPELRREFNCPFCIANGENMASGSGLNAKCVKDITEYVDVITTGDHIWDQKSFEQEIRQFDHVLRPANLSERQPGNGWKIFRNPGGGEFAVINLQGTIFVRESAYCPFETAEKILEEIPSRVKCIIVDFHAEATSEKIAMGYFLEGKVTAILGTHTHVQTADAKILPGGTAYITDVGMTGAERSVLGRDVDAVVEKFRTGLPRRFTVIEKGIRMDAVVVTYNLQTGEATAIKNISRMSSV
ncbi:TIGR00282 family metallophosphoesterase [Lentisphaerota bacterium ZTH]|nr:TIGR00282 family metallophosphoesterase [Lentisphaerota bacterium]WET06156.1 TIGR00282 family metallophosphoesterase [Lentisphaerota bacterium ZTH]